MSWIPPPTSSQSATRRLVHRFKSAGQFITIGKSTATELRQKWGEPKWSGHWEGDNPKNPEFLLYDYDAQEEFIIKIRVEAETKTGKVTSIDIGTEELPLSKAIELFGKDYIEIWYKTCNKDTIESVWEELYIRE